MFEQINKYIITHSSNTGSLVYGSFLLQLPLAFPEITALIRHERLQVDRPET